MHVHKEYSKSRRSLLISTLLNFFITVVQVIGGILSNSLSLLSDALHNLGDSAAIFVAYLANRYGDKKANAKKTFGYKRIEVIAALFNSVTLILICLFLFYEAWQRFHSPEPVKGKLMLIVATAGLIFNLVSVYLLNPHKKSNLNIKAAYLHLLGDTLSSFAVILGGIAIMFWEIYWIDPLITLLIAVYLILHTLKVFRSSFNILMQASPQGIDRDILKMHIETYPEINNVHHIHIWTLDDQKHFLECHIQLNDNLRVSDTQGLSSRLKKDLRDKFNIEHLTLQYEVEHCVDEG